MIKTENEPGRNMIRAGIGQDSHPFLKNGNKPLVLGGVIIPKERGMEGNSDGDVIIHSICNAFSQAIGEKSFGVYTDTMCLKEGITDSKQYLRFFYQRIKEKGYKIGNIGIMVEAKRPKIELYADKMKEVLSVALGINKEQIGITATSGEGLTSFGKGKGIQVFSIVVLMQK